jgi:SPP1 gp7 family putative phage head morphogenesis protein
MPPDQEFWQEHYAEILQTLIEIWTEAAWSGMMAVIETMDQAGMPAVDPAEIWAAIMLWISNNVSDEAMGILTTTMAAVEEAFSLWDGEDEEALAALLDPIFNEYRAETIGITETILGVTIGNLITWQAYGIIEEVIWVTAEDERVCPICRPLHETVFSIEEAIYGSRPPAHPRCRCWLEAVLVIQKSQTLADALFKGKVTEVELEKICRVVV